MGGWVDDEVASCWLMMSLGSMFEKWSCLLMVDEEGSLG